MSYDAVLFDLDGVLLTGRGTDPEVYEAAARTVLGEYGVEYDAVPDWIRAPMDAAAVRQGCETDGLPPEEVWSRRERAACEIGNERIAAGERSLHDDVSVLVDLDAAVGIVSNNRQEMVDFVVDHFDLPVDAAYGRAPTLTGYDRRKPDPHYLELALGDVGVAASDALFVGDRRSDVRAARNAGTDAALLVRDEIPPGEPAPDYVVESLFDLPTG